MSIITFPRNFVSLKDNDSEHAVTESAGDHAVAELYDIYANGERNTQGLHYRMAVLDAALRLFGDWNRWVSLQSHNQGLSGYSLQCLSDTLDTLNGHCRCMSPWTWMDLMADQKRLAYSPTVKTHRLPQAPSVGMGTEEVLQRWCSKPQGFYDLLQTLYAFFGPSIGTK